MRNIIVAVFHIFIAITLVNGDATEGKTETATTDQPTTTKADEIIKTRNAFPSAEIVTEAATVKDLPCSATTNPDEQTTVAELNVPRAAEPRSRKTKKCKCRTSRKFKSVIKKMEARLKKIENQLKIGTRHENELLTKPLTYSELFGIKEDSDLGNRRFMPKLTLLPEPKTKYVIDIKPKTSNASEAVNQSLMIMKHSQLLRKISHMIKTLTPNGLNVETNEEIKKYAAQLMKLAKRKFKSAVAVIKMNLNENLQALKSVKINAKNTLTIIRMLREGVATSISDVSNDTILTDTAETKDNALTITEQLAKALAKSLENNEPIDVAHVLRSL